jgi:hypothetical protein
MAEPRGTDGFHPPAKTDFCQRVPRNLPLPTLLRARRFDRLIGRRLAVEGKNLGYLHRSRDPHEVLCVGSSPPPPASACTCYTLGRLPMPRTVISACTVSAVAPWAIFYSGALRHTILSSWAVQLSKYMMGIEQGSSVMPPRSPREETIHSLGNESQQKYRPAPLLPHGHS